MIRFKSITVPPWTCLSRLIASWLCNIFSYHACKYTCKKLLNFQVKNVTWEPIFYFRWWDVEWVSKCHHPQVRWTGKSLWYVEKVMQIISLLFFYFWLIQNLLKKKEHNEGFCGFCFHECFLMSSSGCDVLLIP